MADEGGWTNHIKDILLAELGQEEYEKRLKKQENLFKTACKSGTLFSKIPIKFETEKFKKLFQLSSSKSGKRGTHLNGIGAEGIARVVDDPKLPKNEFFKPGRMFEVRSRHSNFPDGTEDTKLGVRSLALKFCDFDEESPLDLILHTGPKSPFFNIDSVSELLTGLKGGTETTKKYLLSLPVYLDAHVLGVRHLPDSYYHQHYYAQTVFNFKADDGKQRLLRFRALPADGSSESGLMAYEEQKVSWNMETPEGTDLDKDYLKKEFSERLRRETVKYILQFQIHKVAEGSTLDHNMYNASEEWPSENHPWNDLMMIMLYKELPHNVTEVTRFNIGNLPKAVLGFSPPMTEYDFNVVPRMRVEVYRGASSCRPKYIRDSSMKYDITVVTGNDKDAGTDADIFLSIIGVQSRTSFHKLDHIIWDDFEKGSSGNFKVEDADVGEILCIKVHVKNPGKDNWQLSYITISVPGEGEEKKMYTFPCYRWFTEKVHQMTLFQGKAVLPQDELNPYLKQQRQLEVQERKALFQWRPRGKDAGLENYPGYINAGAVSNDLPRDAQFDGEKTTEIAYKRIIGRQNAFFGMLRTKIGKAWRDLKGDDVIHEKTLLITSLVEHTVTLDYIMKHWHEDEEFGRQVLQGINPMKITRVVQLPENFPVTEEMVKESLEEGKTLADEIQAGKMYLIAYPELEEYCEVRSGQERFMCAPMCLLYVQAGKLIPIAIQLTNSPEADTPIWTKKDDITANGNKYSDWLIAKMWVRVADTNSHQLATHLMGTHLIMEPIALALQQNIPSRHPIYKLLISHMRFVMAINTLGREVLIPDGTAISLILAVAEESGQHVKFMEKIYQGLTFDSLNIPKNLSDRGVNDSSLLPDFCYRDDALVLWEAIKDFVEQLMGIYYKEDLQVAEDTELKAFLENLRQNGFHENMGLSKSFESREDIVNFLVPIIFCCSCQHAAVNFGQLDIYGFAPNAPPCMMLPPPTEKNPEGISSDDMKKLLTSHEISERFIGVANLLSMYSDKELYLGEYPNKYFSDPEAQKAIEAFQSNLKDISTKMHERNKKLPVPYMYLLPEKVPNSIAI